MSISLLWAQNTAWDKRNKYTWNGHNRTHGCKEHAIYSVSYIISEYRQECEESEMHINTHFEICEYSKVLVEKNYLARIIKIRRRGK